MNQQVTQLKNEWANIRQKTEVISSHSSRPWPKIGTPMWYAPNDVYCGVQPSVVFVEGDVVYRRYLGQFIEDHPVLPAPLPGSLGNVGRKLSLTRFSIHCFEWVFWLNLIDGELVDMYYGRDKLSTFLLLQNHYRRRVVEQRGQAQP